MVFVSDAKNGKALVVVAQPSSSGNSNSSKKRKNKRKPRGKKQQNGASSSSLSRADVVSTPMAECASMLIKGVLGSPETEIGEVCNFGEHTAKAFRYSTTVRFEAAATATDGIALCVIPAAGNNQPSIFQYNNANPALQTQAAIAAGTGYTMRGSPFASAGFNDAILESRWLGGCISIENTTAPLYRTGSMVGYSEQDPQGLSGTFSVANMKAESRARYVRATQKLTVPFLNTTERLDPFHDHWSSSGSTAITPVMLYLPPQGAAATLLVKARIFFEVRGRTVAQMASVPPGIDDGLYTDVMTTMSEIIYSASASFASPHDLIEAALKKLGPHFASLLIENKNAIRGSIVQGATRLIKSLYF